MMKPQASRSLIWALIESGGLSVVSLVVIFVVARRIGPSELGTVSLALSIVQMLAIVVDTMLHDAIVQRHRLEDDHLHTAFWVCILCSLSFAGLCWAAAPVFAQIFETPDLQPLLSVAAIGLVFSGMGSVPLAVLRRRMMFKPITLRTLYGRLSGAVVAIILVLLGHGVWCLIAQYLVQVMVNTILVWPACPWRPKMRFSFARFRELIAFGALSVGSRIVWLSSIRLFTMLVGYFIGVSAVGYLNIAQRVIDTLYDVMAGAAYNLALPIFSRYQKTRESLVQVFHSASEFAALAIPPIFIGLAVCASPIVSLLLGDEWLPSAPLIQILAVGAMLQFIMLFANTAITAIGRPGLIFMLSLLSFAFVIGVFLIARPSDPFEAAVVWVSRIMLTAPAVLLIIHRYLGVAPRNLLRDIWAPLAVTGTMAAILVGLQREVLEGAPAIQLLLIMVPLGVVIYGAGLAVACRDSLRRFLQFIALGLRRTKTL